MNHYSPYSLGPGYDAWLTTQPDFDDAVEIDHAQALIDALTLTTLGKPLRDDAPDAGYFDSTPEYALGEELCCSSQPGINDEAMRVILLAARGQNAAGAAQALLRKLADEFAGRIA